MRISRIYFDGVIKCGADLTLPLHTSHYLMHVLRLKVGATVMLFNGDGNEYVATVISVSKRQIVLTIGDMIQKNNESGLTIHLAQAISKSEKMDWTIQKAVELGVSQITPLITDYCAVKLDPERMAKRLDHWQKIIISACEQSGRTYIPSLSPIKQFNDWVQGCPRETTKLFCHPGSPMTISQLEIVKNVVVLIGPEGGLSDQEISVALQSSFVGISLGPRILRTETAALAVIAILQSHLGDF